jgi:hypothetical protein
MKFSLQEWAGVVGRALADRAKSQWSTTPITEAPSLDSQAAFILGLTDEQFDLFSFITLVQGRLAEEQVLRQFTRLATAGKEKN